MVYCKLAENKVSSAIYDFGASVNDMTGTIEFFVDKEPKIIKEPDAYHVSKNWIDKLWFKHRDEFRNKQFKEKLAYECG